MPKCKACGEHRAKEELDEIGLCHACRPEPVEQKLEDFLEEDV